MATFCHAKRAMWHLEPYKLGTIWHIFRLWTWNDRHNISYVSFRIWGLSYLRTTNVIFCRQWSVSKPCVCNVKLMTYRSRWRLLIVKYILRSFKRALDFKTIKCIVHTNHLMHSSKAIDVDKYRLRTPSRTIKMCDYKRATCSLKAVDVDKYSLGRERLF